MLVLSEPSQGGKMWEKKEKWFSYGVTRAHKKTQFLFGMGNTKDKLEDMDVSLTFCLCPHGAMIFPGPL